MQGLIHILLRHCNIIFKTTRNRLVHLMNNTKGRITVLHCIHNNTHRKQIIDLIQCLVLIDHLLVNAKEMLNTAIHLCLDTALCHMLTDFFHNGIYKSLTLTALQIDLSGQIIIHFRFQVSQ